MFKAIEVKANWPKVMLCRSVFHLKEPDNLLDPRAYRLLNITPKLHKVYMVVRLRHLCPWVQTWATDDRFAGCNRTGAEAAWITTSLIVGKARLLRQDATRGATDVWKCFDQVLKELLD